MEGITLMAKREKTPQEIFAEKFVSELQPKTVEDVKEGLKSIFGPIFKSMLKRNSLPTWAMILMTTIQKQLQTAATALIKRL